MPNGNVLVITWERETTAEAIAAGRQNLPAGEIWPTAIFEYEQDGLNGANVVWEWHLWDHLIQDADSTKDKYGVLADHTELLDINYPRAPNGRFDHANALTYNPTLDQIVFSGRASTISFAFNKAQRVPDVVSNAVSFIMYGGTLILAPRLLHRTANRKSEEA